jgi:hypothetical protein
MDLSETSIPNDFDIRYYLHGEKESFAADLLTEASSVEHQPLYFIEGDFKADEKGPKTGNKNRETVSRHEIRHRRDIQRPRKRITATKTSKLVTLVSGE